MSNCEWGDWYNGGWGAVIEIYLICEIRAFANCYFGCIIAGPIYGCQGHNLAYRDEFAHDLASGVLARYK